MGHSAWPFILVRHAARSWASPLHPFTLQQTQCSMVLKWHREINTRQRYLTTLVDHALPHSVHLSTVEHQLIDIENIHWGSARGERMRVSHSHSRVINLSSTKHFCFESAYLG